MGVKGGGEGEIRQGGETGRGEETCIIYDNLPDNDCYPKDITVELTGSVGSEVSGSCCCTSAQSITRSILSGLIILVCQAQLTSFKRAHCFYSYTHFKVIYFGDTEFKSFF